LFSILSCLTLFLLLVSASTVALENKHIASGYLTLQGRCQTKELILLARFNPEETCVGLGMLGLLWHWYFD
jgi:hypothetical protein